MNGEKKLSEADLDMVIGGREPMEQEMKAAEKAQIFRKEIIDDYNRRQGIASSRDSDELTEEELDKVTGPTEINSGYGMHK